MKSVIRFGILGCGIIAPFHVEAILRAEGAEYVGGCSKSISSAQRLCSQYGGIVYESYEKMLQDPQIDAVVICTPSGGHFTECQQALLAGKHVVVEKPMCMSTEEADELIVLADRTHLMLCAISQNRFAPAAQIVRTAIRNGDFGKLISASLTMRYERDQAYFDQAAWRGTIAADGGMLMNQGLHGIDLLCCMMGTPVKVCGFSRTLLRDVEIEDTVTAAVEFENGALATVDATLCSQPEMDRKIIICGEKGTAILEGDAITLWSLPTPKPEIPAEQLDKWTDLLSMPIYCCSHALQYDNILQHLLYGASLEVDARQGKVPLTLISGIYKSSKENRFIDLMAQ